MQTTTRKIRRLAKVTALGVATVMGLGACIHVAHMFSHRDVPRPPAQEFGTGPRASSAGTYSATVEPSQGIEVGRLESWKLRVHTADGSPLEDATIEVDGGMPQHGHGLPTRPRVTRSLGGGVYVVDGMKFNMGGWWEVKFRIASAAGTDSVTFNLDL